jgi:hypothetical protein
MATGALKPAAPAAAAPSSRAALAVSVIDGRQFRPVVVPRTAVQGVMRLVTRGEMHEIRAACRQMMAALGIAGGGIESFPEWREEFNLRLVATAVRHPAARETPLADLEEWRQCDPDQVDALWSDYEDMAAELDPLGDRFVLEEKELLEIIELAKAGDVGRLTSYGSPKLARALRSMAAPPAT